MAYLKINGVEITNLVEYDDLLSTQDGDDSGRNPALVMNRDILGRILSITAKKGVCTQAEGMQLLNLLKNPEMSVEYYNSETGKMETCSSMYCVDPKKSRVEGMFNYFKEIEFTLNSNQKYD